MDIVVVDACLAITFGNAERFEILSSNPSRQIVIPPRSVREVAREPARSILARALADSLVSTGAVDLDDVRELEQFRRFNEIPAFRDRGDAEVMALAMTRGWIVGSDDAAMRSHAARAIGAARVAGSLDFLVWAVREGRITLAEAEDVLAKLDVGRAVAARLSASGSSLAALI